MCILHLKGAKSLAKEKMFTSDSSLFMRINVQVKPGPVASMLSVVVCSYCKIFQYGISSSASMSSLLDVII